MSELTLIDFGFLSKQKQDVLNAIIPMLNNSQYLNAIRYVENAGLGRTGSGIHKVVFSLGANKVLKIAKGYVGAKDIEQETISYACAPKFFPEVFASGKGWAIVERIRNTYRTNKNLGKEVNDYFGFDYNKINEILGGKWSSFYDVAKFFQQYYFYKDSPKHKQVKDIILSNSNFFEFIQSVKRCGLNLYDLHLNNYGFNTKGDFVIIDIEYGTHDFSDLVLSET
jgi:hypothetical protein